MEDINYYELLGIPQDASKSDIKKAYKKMVIMYHPDKVANLGPKLKHVANEEMKKINMAKDVLMSEDERAAYDASMKQKAPAAPVGAQAPASGPEHDEIVRFNTLLLEARKYIDDLRKIDGDVREPENFFIQAKYAANNNNIAKAIELAEHSREAAKTLLYKYTVNVLLLSKEKLLKHREGGVDIGKAFERFLEARSLMMADDYLGAVEISLDAVNLANDIARRLRDDAGAKRTMPSIVKEPEIVKEDSSEPIPKGYVATWDEESHQEDLEAYKGALMKVWADGVVTEEEQEELDRLKDQLGVGSEEHEKLEREVKERRRGNVKLYMDAMMRVLEDGIIDEDEHEELARLRKELKLENDMEFSI